MERKKRYTYGVPYRPVWSTPTIPPGYILGPVIDRLRGPTAHGTVTYYRPLTDKEIEAAQIIPILSVDDAADLIVAKMGKYAEAYRTGSEKLFKQTVLAKKEALGIEVNASKDLLERRVMRKLNLLAPRKNGTFQRKYQKREPETSGRHDTASSSGEFVSAKELAAQLRAVWPEVKGITAKFVEVHIEPEKEKYEVGNRGSVMLVGFYDSIDEYDLWEHADNLKAGFPWDGRLGRIAKNLSRYQGSVFPWER